MSVKLNHLIVPADNKISSASFLVLILGLPEAAHADPFLAVSVDNEVTLDFLEVDYEIVPQHYAFMVDEERFQKALDQIIKMNLPYWADPFHRQQKLLGNAAGGRCFYFNDPSGHNMEVIAA